MAKSNGTFVDVNQKPIAGYQFGMYWLGCNGRTISGLCGDSFKSEGELLASYDNTGAGGGIIRVYEDGSQVVLRNSPKAE